MAIPKAKGYRPRCFFDVTLNGEKAGRIIFELLADICPRTSENFRALCTGEAGVGKVTGKHLHFKGCPFHRVVKDFMIQGGDFTAGNGTGGESIYGGTFDDECLDLKHDSAMLLSMANRGPNTNGSQFFITTKPAPHLNGIHVIFGRVIQGVEIVQDLENQPTNEKSRPLADVRIENCGELIPKSKAKAEKLKEKQQASSDESESESESSDEERKRNKERKKRKKAKEAKQGKRREKRTSENDGKSSGTEKEKSKSSTEPAPFSDNPLYMPSVVIETVPDVPTSSFLLRRSRTPSPVREKRKEEMKRRGNSPPGYRAPPLQVGTSKPRISSSGRILRGRGKMRYRTPPPESQQESSIRRRSRSRSRSRSPYRRRHSRSPRRSFHDSRRPSRRGRSRSRSRSPIRRRNSPPARRNERRGASPPLLDHSRRVPLTQDSFRNGREQNGSHDNVRRERHSKEKPTRLEDDRRALGQESTQDSQEMQIANSSGNQHHLSGGIANKSRWERHHSSDDELSRQAPIPVSEGRMDHLDSAKDTGGRNIFSSVTDTKLLDNESEIVGQRVLSERKPRKRIARSSSPETKKKSRKTHRKSRSNSESSPEITRKVNKRKSRSRSSSERDKERSRKQPGIDGDRSRGRKSRSREKKTRPRERKSRSRERKSRSPERKSSSRERKIRSREKRSRSCERKSSSRERKSRSRERKSRSRERKSRSRGRKSSSHERKRSAGRRDKQSGSRDRRSRSRERGRRNRSREKGRKSRSRSRRRRRSRSRSRVRREKSKSRSPERRRKSSSRSRSGRRRRRSRSRSRSRSHSTSNKRSSGWSKRKPKDSSSDSD